MDNSYVDVIIVGGGQSGLGASYYLKKRGIQHIIFERGSIAESWRSQRWHSFKMNSINRLNTLPGQELNGFDPEGFSTNTDFVASMERYVAAFGLPVSEHATVISIDKQSAYFQVTVFQNNTVKHFLSNQVIISSGAQSEIKIPSFAKNISSRIRQFHASEYRCPDGLPTGAVLVVGSGQSGIQIAEDLLEAGRKVYLSTSMVGRVPRRYRGRDIMDWLLLTKFFDVRTQDVTDPSEFNFKTPHLTGTGVLPRTISLQYLASKGVMILGKLHHVDGQKIHLETNGKQHVQFADMFSDKVKHMIDAFIDNAGLDTPPAEEDPADIADQGGYCASSITEMNLTDEDVTSIIWTTGFTGDFSYIKLPVLDDEGKPKHNDGISDIDGLYFLGLPWLRTRKSALIHGVKEDAEFICNRVSKYKSMQLRH